MSVPKKQKPYPAKTRFTTACARKRAHHCSTPRTKQRNRNDRRPRRRSAPRTRARRRARNVLPGLVKMPLQVLYFPEDPPPDIDAQRRSDRNAIVSLC